MASQYSSIVNMIPAPNAKSAFGSQSNTGSKSSNASVGSSDSLSSFQTQLNEEKAKGEASSKQAGNTSQDATFKASVAAEAQNKAIQKASENATAEDSATAIAQQDATDTVASHDRTLLSDKATKADKDSDQQPEASDDSGSSADYAAQPPQDILLVASSATPAAIGSTVSAQGTDTDGEAGMDALSHLAGSQSPSLTDAATSGQQNGTQSAGQTSDQAAGQAAAANGLQGSAGGSATNGAAGTTGQAAASVSGEAASTNSSTGSTGTQAAQTPATGSAFEGSEQSAAKPADGNGATNPVAQTASGSEGSVNGVELAAQTRAQATSAAAETSARAFQSSTGETNQTLTAEGANSQSSAQPQSAEAAVPPRPAASADSAAAITQTASGKTSINQSVASNDNLATTRASKDTSNQTSNANAAVAVANTDSTSGSKQPTLDGTQGTTNPSASVLQQDTEQTVPEVAAASKSVDDKINTEKFAQGSQAAQASSGAPVETSNTVGKDEKAAILAAATKSDDGAQDTQKSAKQAVADPANTQQTQMAATSEAGLQVNKTQGRVEGAPQPANANAAATAVNQSNSVASAADAQNQTTSQDGSTSEADASVAKSEESKNAARNAPKGDAFSKMMAMADEKSPLTSNTTSSSDTTGSSLAAASATVRLTGMHGMTTAGHTPQQMSLANSNAIAVEISKFVKKGETRFEIRLDPADLGKIDVRMTIGNDGKTHAHLMVERPETLDMLSRDQRFLERSLQQSGLNLQDKGGLEYSLMDQGNQGQQGGQMAGQDQSGQEPSYYSDQASSSESVVEGAASALQQAQQRAAQNYTSTSGLNLVI